MTILAKEPTDTTAPAAARPEARGMLAWFVPAMLLAVALRIPFAIALVPDGLGDDGYITLRYAANLIEGHGFVYNPGEPVWGTTTPLLTLLLYAGALLFGVGALETCALAIGIAASFTFWLVMLLLFEQQRLPRRVSVPALLLMMFAPPYFANSVLGMETPLVLALMALSLYWYTTDRSVLLGVTFALLLMTRIDTLIWIGILGGGYVLWQWRVNPRAIVKSVTAFLVAALPWHLYAFLTFGSVVPHSVVGKAVSHAAFSALDWSYFVRVYHVYFPVLWLGPFAWLGVALTAAVALVGLWRLWHDYPLFRPLPVFVLCFAAIFLAGRAPLYMWYFPPSHWVAFLLFCLGLYTLWSRWTVDVASPAVRLAPFGALTACVLAYGVYGVHSAWQKRSANRHWAELGEFIRTSTPQGSRVFLEHIGLVGYKSRRPILDNMGLVSPDIVALKREHPADYEWLRVALMRFTPDVVVLYPPQDPVRGSARWDEEEQAWFTRAYRFVKRIDSDPTSYVYFRAGRPSQVARAVAAE